MAGYTLTYFDIRGLAEVPRLTLAASGVEWKDDRLAFSRNDDGTMNKGDWEERKKTMPYGQVPVLSVDGELLAQSSSITRFIAQRHGLAGASDVEAAFIDAGFEAVQDIRKAFFTNKADAPKLEQFWSTGFAQALGYLNHNVRGSTYFAASNKLSYVDIAIYYLIYVLSTENKEAVDAAVKQNVKIAAICDAVAKEEKIAAYLAKRKDTPM